jgi:hypothetical protein
MRRRYKRPQHPKGLPRKTQGAVTPKPQTVADKLSLLTESALAMQAARVQPAKPEWSRGLRPVPGSNPNDIHRQESAPAVNHTHPAMGRVPNMLVRQGPKAKRGQLVAKQDIPTGKPSPVKTSIKHGGTMPAKLFLRRGLASCLKCKHVVRQLPTCDYCCTHLLAGPFPKPIRPHAPWTGYEQQSAPPAMRTSELFK